jgi:RNA polymerase sigma factor (sigma-70 family)
MTWQLRQLAGKAQTATLTDRQLLDRFLAASEETAFAELVRRHGPMVLATCRRVLHHQQDAEDAFQAAFLVLARKADSVRHAESVAGWLYQVAFRLALRARGKAARHMEPLTAMHEPTAPDRRDDLQAALDDALEQLPDHYRAAVVLCYLEGKTQTDAARQLATTPDAINSRLKRARQLLRTRLTRRGLLLTTAALAVALGGRRAAGAVPAELLGRTSRAALGFASHFPGPAGASPAAVALAQGALRTMSHPLKLLTGLLLVLILVLAAAWGPNLVRGDDPTPAPVRAAVAAPQAKEAGGGKDKPARMRCIILWMSGGPSQFETFDPKPGNANGGPTKAIRTTVKDLQISEHLPKLAKVAEHLAIIRSLTHGDGDHGRGTMLMHTGHPPDGVTPYPSLGSILGKELGDDGSALPRFVSISAIAKDPFSGTTPGFLGAKFGPLHVGAPADGKNVKPRDALRVPPLESFQAISKDDAEAMRKAVLKAFDLDEEKKAVKDAYGDTVFGQGCLLARRMVEVGVPAVEVTLPGWDTHADNFAIAKARCEQLDAAFSALLTDLKDRKLLDSTLIVWMGEFGRTPRINGNNGRDHWPFGFSVVLAGAKIKGGQAIGVTSDDGTVVAKRPVTVEEFFATIYQAVGVDPAKENRYNAQLYPLVPKGTKAVAEALR